MKKLSVLLILVMVFSMVAFTACGSSGKADSKSSEEKTETQEPETEEPEETKIDSPLVGTWFYQGNNVEQTYVFNDDGTGKEIFVLSGNKVEHEYTYEIQDNKFVITYEDDSQVTEEFSIDGDAMHTKTEEGEFDYVRQ